MTRGGRPLADVSQSLDAVLKALAIGGSGWLPRWPSPRIDRVLFAASKADHVPSDQHPAMEALLRRSLSESTRRTPHRGAERSEEHTPELHSPLRTSYAPPRPPHNPPPPPHPP